MIKQDIINYKQTFNFMKKLFNLMMLTLAFTLSFGNVADAVSAEPIKGTVEEFNDDAQAQWELTAEEVEAGVFELRFAATINPGFHGYPLTDMMSGPIFTWEDDSILVGAMTEPLASTLHNGEYEGKVEYAQRVKGNNGDVVKVNVLSTFCQGNMCTSSDCNFEVTLVSANGAVAAPAPAPVADDKAVTSKDIAMRAAELGIPEWVIKAKMVNDKQYEVSFETKSKVTEATLENVRNTSFYINDKAIKLVDDAALRNAKVGNVVSLKSVVLEKGDKDVVEIKAANKKGAIVYDVNIVRAPSKSTSQLDWSSIIAAILWGFAALLTPCVFPMVPMTVSFFVKGSQTPAQGRFRATMYGIFIVALYVLPIAVLLVLSNLTGGNVTTDVFNWLSTHWIPNLIFFIIFMVFAASFFGAFEITMPSKLVNKSDAGAEKGGLVGIFFMALTLVLVSFSCTGPIVGTVLISSASGGNTWMPIFTMAAFAIAFALPFTLLAWFPSMLKNLPKSGGWLNSVKVVLGFIEIALGLKFLMTADQTYHWGLLDREVYLAIWIVTFSLLGLYLLGKIRFAHDDKVEHLSVKRLVLAMVAFSFVVYMIPGMFGAPLKGISGYLPPMKTQDYRVNGKVKNPNTDKKFGDKLEIPHEMEGYFDLDEAMAAAKEQNKPLFIDVTGHACNNCREMETRVWSDNRVMNLLENKYIICALYVDDKMALDPADYYTSAEGKVMTELGRKNFAIAKERWNVTSQPGYVLVTPDGEAMLMPEPLGFETDINKFVNYLETGLENFQNGTTYAAERPGKLSGIEIYDENGNPVETLEVTPVAAPAKK